MPKITLDMNTFKALASDTRLDILRALDGNKMGLKDISEATKLNKATLHEHLVKLAEAGLVKKKEREGHKWVYYKLTWKGEGLLHPENSRIVVLFTTTFISLFFGIIFLFQFIKGKIVAMAQPFIETGEMKLLAAEDSNSILQISDPRFLKAPIAQVPLQNLTVSDLSKTLNTNISLKGAFGNTISDAKIEWTSLDGAEPLAGQVSSIPQSIFAVVHDPALQFIAVACIITFGILLTITIWRYSKNKIPKL
ncbi:MAG: winged helix-turn-helix transcriptional regulator [Thermoplasmatales archaeon]|nr:MAG: winged helix-turn-helix transcriptional regulator [Thermoplasmatales archaeon]